MKCSQMMKYSSVHEYLDEVFEEIECPTEVDIISAKKAYWRMYNTDLKRRQRKTYKEFVIRFKPDEIKYLHDNKPKGQRLSHYIKSFIELGINRGEQTRSFIDTATIEQQLFLISDYLEELLDHEEVNPEKIVELEKRIGELEKLLSRYDN